MGIIFNHKSQKEKRRGLRNNMPKAEVILWTYLKGKQILGYKFRRQVSIGKYIVDFYCPKLNLVIEVDGLNHVNSEGLKQDIYRQNGIEILSINFLRFTNEEIYGDLENVVNCINSKVAELSSRTTDKTSPISPPSQGGDYVKSKMHLISNTFSVLNNSNNNKC